MTTKYTKWTKILKLMPAKVSNLEDEHLKLPFSSCVIFSSSLPVHVCIFLSVGKDVLLEFLEVAIHTLLYTRQLYPAGAFNQCKKYDVPVQVKISLLH